MKPLLWTMALAVGIAACLPTITAADYIPISIPLTPRTAIIKYATIYAVPEQELLMVAQCESGFNPKAVGDVGLARNIFQYHKPTFDAFSKLMGVKLNYDSYVDQAKLTAWIWKYHPEYKRHWSCAKIVGILKK